jgi:hypothetical protein
MVKISRDYAINLLVKIDLLFLSEENRELCLMLAFYEEDKYMQIEDMYDESLNEEIIKQLPSEYEGVTNYYLSKGIKKYLNIHCEVIGEMTEELGICPCCGYKALPDSGGFEMCALCLWQLDYDDPNVYSSLNSSTLSDYKKKFNSTKRHLVDLEKYPLAQDIS